MEQQTYFHFENSDRLIKLHDTSEETKINLVFITSDKFDTFCDIFNGNKLSLSSAFTELNGMWKKTSLESRLALLLFAYEQVFLIPKVLCQGTH